MDFKQMGERVKGILFTPHPEWQKIKTEQTSNKDLILFYVLPFTVIAAVISLIAIWTATFFGFGLALRYAVLQLITPIIAIVVAAVVMNELAETFDSVKNLNNAFKLVTYAYTPALLISIITSISWALSFLGILGLYGGYLLWIGLPVMMKTPEDKRLVYIIIAFVVILVINLIIGALFASNRLGYF